MLNPRLEIAFHLHAYQPPTQKQKIIDQVYRDSYEPIIALTEKRNEVKFSLDIARSLGERLPPEFLERIRKLYQAGKIELVNIPAYHYLLPLVPPHPKIQPRNCKGCLIRHFIAASHGVRLNLTRKKEESRAGVFPCLKKS